MAVTSLALARPVGAEPFSTPDAEWLRLEARAGAVWRTGTQEAPAPGLDYRGWTPADGAVAAEAFTAGTLGFGGFGSLQREGFSVREAGVQRAAGGLWRAAVGPAVRLAVPWLVVDAGVGYGLAQLPDLGTPTAPEFQALARHALLARVGVRVPLPAGLELEARAEAPLWHGGAGLDGGGHGWTLGGALGIPVARLAPGTWLRARLGYQAVVDGWSRGGAASAQTLQRLGLGVEVALGRPSARSEASPSDAPAPEASEETPAAPALASLRVRVQGAQGRGPLAQAWMRAVEREIGTDEAGRATLDGLAPGNVSVEFGAPGYRTAAEVVSLVEGGVLDLDVELVPVEVAAPAVVTGQVRSARTGAALAALLTVQGVPGKVAADAAGRFTLELEAGSYRIQISAPGHLTQRKRLVLRSGERTILNVDLHPERR